MSFTQYISIPFALTALLASGACAMAVGVQGSDYYREAILKTLLRAGAKADIRKAKEIADQARDQHIPGISQKMLDTVDACYAAGEPKITAGEKAAIDRNLRIVAIYSPNANMKYATGFANGWGVKQDFRRAVAFVCHAGKVPVEMANQVRGLKLMESWARSGELAGKLNGQAFTFCTFAVSAGSYRQCRTFAAARKK